MEGYQNREIRGMVMKILKEAAPDPVGDQLISAMLTDARYEVKPADVKKHLNYLEGKGYIKTEKVSLQSIGVSRTIARLTPEGQDLMDGTIDPDAGVEVIP